MSDKDKLIAAAEKAHTPTDEEREVLANLIPLDLVHDREREGFPRDAFEAADRILARGFRLTEVPESSVEYVRGGVCLLCGDGVLNSGEHIDPERHAAEVQRITDGSEPSAETKLRTWIAGEPFEVSQARTGQPVAKVPETQQQGYVNGYAAAVEHVAAILDAEPQGEPSDAQIEAATRAVEKVPYTSSMYVTREGAREIAIAALRAARGAQ